MEHNLEGVNSECKHFVILFDARQSKDIHAKDKKSKIKRKETNEMPV